MTQNQIAYWELEEKKRGNRAVEAETKRHNQATEFIQAGTLEESKRHNVVSEGIAFGTLAETQRSNKAREAETNRSNLANEALKHESNLYTREVGMAQVAESNRHNVQMENETARHDMAQEEYQYYKTNVDRQLQERGFLIKEGELAVSEGNLELSREKVYGGSGKQERGATYDHSFSGSGSGDSSFKQYTPTLEREIEERKLDQQDVRLLQQWLSTGGELLSTSSKLVDIGLSYLTPLIP